MFAKSFREWKHHSDMQNFRRVTRNSKSVTRIPRNVTRDTRNLFFTRMTRQGPRARGLRLQRVHEAGERPRAPRARRQHRRRLGGGAGAGSLAGLPRRPLAGAS